MSFLGRSIYLGHPIFDPPKSDSIVPMKGQPSNDEMLAMIRLIIPLQSATKAIYYYSIGLPSLAAYLTARMDEISQATREHRELGRVLALLRSSAASAADTGSPEAPALRAGNPTQRPYSDVLQAVESGDVSSRSLRAILDLFARNGFK